MIAGDSVLNKSRKCYRWILVTVRADVNIVHTPVATRLSDLRLLCCGSAALLDNPVTRCLHFYQSFAFSVRVPFKKRFPSVSNLNILPPSAVLPMDSEPSNRFPINQDRPESEFVSLI